jgi:hypothetical protein
MVYKGRLTSEDRATTSARDLFIFCLSEEVCNILGKMTNCVMTPKATLRKCLILASRTGTGNLLNILLGVLRMFRIDMIVQGLLRGCFIRAVLALVFQGTIVVCLVVHVHRGLLKSCKSTMRAYILVVCIFLIYEHHGAYLSPTHRFQFLEILLL